MIKIEHIVEAALSDGMAMAKLPGAAAAVTVWRTILRRRQEVARDILFEELKKEPPAAKPLLRMKPYLSLFLA